MKELLAQYQDHRTLSEEVSKFSKEVNKALSGKHTKALYNACTHKEAATLVQLRTGIARLNGYLHRIGAQESAQCECGAAKETVKHFLFRCSRWDLIRKKWESEDRAKRGNLAWALGGKEVSDKERWKPNMEAVKRTIGFALATMRLQAKPEDNASQTR